MNTGTKAICPFCDNALGDVEPNPIWFATKIVCPDCLDSDQLFETIRVTNHSDLKDFIDTVNHFFEDSSSGSFEIYPPTAIVKTVIESESPEELIKALTYWIEGDWSLMFVIGNEIMSVTVECGEYPDGDQLIIKTAFPIFF